ncbi:hypothetical protein Srufu_080070 (plasmid) [Streptomyces libani subsp. rufus]|nr:hypothetical protein Srufu_080070 [Streptomyces libani subsp. rufus]
MKTEGTTSTGDGNDERQARHQRRRDLWRQRGAVSRQRLRNTRPFRRPRQERPMWQEPLRGALYAAGSGIVALAIFWFQSRM